MSDWSMSMPVESAVASKVDLFQNEAVKTFVLPSSSHATCMAFSRNMCSGRALALGDNQGCLRVYRASMPLEKPIVTINAPLRCLSWECSAPAGLPEETIIGGSDEGEIVKFDMRWWKVGYRFKAHSAACSSVAFMPSSQVTFLTTGSTEGAVKLWDDRHILSESRSNSIAASYPSHQETATAVMAHKQAEPLNSATFLERSGTLFATSGHGSSLIHIRDLRNIHTPVNAIRTPELVETSTPFDAERRSQKRDKHTGSSQLVSDHSWRCGVAGMTVDDNFQMLSCFKRCGQIVIYRIIELNNEKAQPVFTIMPSERHSHCCAVSWCAPPHGGRAGIVTGERGRQFSIFNTANNSQEMVLSWRPQSEGDAVDQKQGAVGNRDVTSPQEKGKSKSAKESSKGKTISGKPEVKSLMTPDFKSPPLIGVVRRRTRSGVRHAALEDAPWITSCAWQDPNHSLGWSRMEDGGIPASASTSQPGSLIALGRKDGHVAMIEMGRIVLPDRVTSPSYQTPDSIDDDGSQSDLSTLSTCPRIYSYNNQTPEITPKPVRPDDDTTNGGINREQPVAARQNGNETMHMDATDEQGNSLKEPNEAENSRVVTPLGQILSTVGDSPQKDKLEEEMKGIVSSFDATMELTDLTRVGSEGVSLTVATNTRLSAVGSDQAAMLSSSVAIGNGKAIKRDTEMNEGAAARVTGGKRPMQQSTSIKSQAKRQKLLVGTVPGMYATPQGIAVGEKKKQGWHAEGKGESQYNTSVSSEGRDPEATPFRRRQLLRHRIRRTTGGHECQGHQAKRFSLGCNFAMNRKSPGHSLRTPGMSCGWRRRKSTPNPRRRSTMKGLTPVEHSSLTPCHETPDAVLHSLRRTSPPTQTDVGNVAGFNCEMSDGMESQSGNPELQGQKLQLETLLLEGMSTFPASGTDQDGDDDYDATPQRKPPRCTDLMLETPPSDDHTSEESDENLSDGNRSVHLATCHMDTKEGRKTRRRRQQQPREVQKVTLFNYFRKDPRSA